MNPTNRDNQEKQKKQEKRTNNRSRGRVYEKRAEDFLVSHGYAIIERNWQASHKEIDLIARKGKTIVFVEVKGSSTTQFGHPAERVDRKKRQNLIAAAEQYIAGHDLTGCDFRMDLITFHEGRLEHYPNAFGGER